MQNLGYLRFVTTGLGYLLRREVTPGPPVFFTIETINTCNLRCVYCPQSGPDHFPNGRGTMSLGNFRSIVAELKRAFSMRTVSLHRDGEPLLNPDLEAYVAHATGEGVYVTMSTNGSLVTRERAMALLGAGLRMANSDFCADAATYESLRVRGRWERTLEGLTHLLIAAHESERPFRLLIKDLGTAGCALGTAAKRLDATRKLFARWSDRVDVIPVNFHNALGESAIDMSASTDQPEARKDYSLCHQPWVNMTIDWAGRVVACCRDLRSEYVLGSLLEQPADEVWNGPAARRLRSALSRKRPGEIGVCASCDLPWHGSYSGRTPVQRAVRFFSARAWSRD